MSFYTRDGLFLSNYIDKDQRVDTESASFRRYIQTLPWLDDADNTSGFVLLSPHPDYFSPANQERSIYGIVQAVRHHGRIIGYLQISDDAETLTNLMTFVDNEQVYVEAVFDNGQRLFSSMNQFVPWAEDVPENEFTTVTLDTGDSRSVLHTHVDALSLHCVVANCRQVCHRQMRAGQYGFDRMRRHQLTLGDRWLSVCCQGLAPVSL